MKEHFLTYEQSLAVNELGFDGECMGYWNTDPYLDKPTFNMVKPFEHEWCLPAPLKSQFFKWVREKHGINSYIRHECPDVDYYYEYVINEHVYDGIFSTYEQAEDACINKIIELIKNK